MIVAMRTKVQAQQVAELTGGRVIHKDNQPTCKVSLPGDFERYRKDVESISVLFKLYDDAGKSVPSGWTLTGATFEVEWPRDSLINSHFGARRFAYNWALTTVKRDKVVSPANKTPSKPTTRAGVDLGLRSFATLTDSNEDKIVFTNPAPLRASMAELRRTQRRLSRRIPGSHGYEQAKTKLNRLYCKTTYMRRENVHQVTRQLVDTYGEIKIMPRFSLSRGIVVCPAQLEVLGEFFGLKF